MEFRILGPLEVARERTHDRPRRSQTARFPRCSPAQREPPRLDRPLIASLWGERAPGTAHKALQVYVSQLRKALGSRPHPDAISWLRASRRGGRARPRPLRGARLDSRMSEKRSALAGSLRWPTSPTSRSRRHEIARLEELRLTSVERGSTRISMPARHASLVGELEALVREHPLRERLRAQLMLALYRSGRQADALDVYQEGRTLFSDELGLEPGRGAEGAAARDPRPRCELSAPPGTPPEQPTFAVDQAAGAGPTSTRRYARP